MPPKRKKEQPVEEKDESSGGEGSDQEKVPKKKVPAKKQKLITESLAKKDKDKGDNEVEKESLVKLDLPDTEKTTPDGKTWNFKISSWNVAGLRACVKKNGMDYIKQENPDIIALQETKCPESKLPGIVHIDGYHTYWVSGEKEGHAGVGLYSKVKPISVQKGLGIAEHDKEGRVITAEFEKFYLVATYVVNSGQKLKTLDKRMQWNKDFHAHLVDLDKKKPVILAGDLNVAHEKIDLARPDTNKKSAGFTIEERQGFTELLEMGFVDSFRHLYPDLTEAYTFWNYFHNSRAKNVGWRLDYFVLSKRLLENLCDNVIRKDVMGSDHCPITLFLNL